MEKLKRGIKLEKSFFSANADIVATSLLKRGAHIVHRFVNRSLVVGRLCEISAWEGFEKTSSIGMNYAPGTFGISRKFNKYLIDIATGEEYGPSCVTLIAADFKWGEKFQRVQGPGNLSHALQIDEKYDGCSVASKDFWIELREHYDGEILKRSRKDLPPNCRGYFYIK